MFEINVHRQILEQRHRAHKKRRQILFVQIICVAALATLTGIFTLRLFLLQQNMSAKEEGLKEIGEMLAGYEPEMADICVEKVALVSRLKGGGPRWGAKLRAMSSLLPPQMWLTEVSFMNITIEGIQKKVLQVSGSMYFREEQDELGGILAFLNVLRGDKSFSEDFESIELLSSKRSRSSGNDELNFKFICSIHQKDQIDSWENDFSG